MGGSTGQRWLIDGNNVIGTRPNGWWRDRAAAKSRLLADIDRWAAGVPDRVIVVFDGRYDPGLAASLGSDSSVAVRFAGGGRRDAADDLIVAESSAGDRVVTADRGLIARLVPGVEIVGPNGFLTMLDDTA